MQFLYFCLFLLITECLFVVFILCITNNNKKLIELEKFTFFFIKSKVKNHISKLSFVLQIINFNFIFLYLSISLINSFIINSHVINLVLSYLSIGLSLILVIATIITSLFELLKK